MVGALSDLSTKAVIATLLWEFDYCRGVTDPLDTSTDTPTNMVPPLPLFSLYHNFVPVLIIGNLLCFLPN